MAIIVKILPNNPEEIIKWDTVDNLKDYLEYMSDSVIGLGDSVTKVFNKENLIGIVVNREIIYRLEK